MAFSDTSFILFLVIKKKKKNNEIRKIPITFSLFLVALRLYRIFRDNTTGANLTRGRRETLSCENPWKKNYSIPRVRNVQMELDEVCQNAWILFFPKKKARRERKTTPGLVIQLTLSTTACRAARSREWTWCVYVEKKQNKRIKNTRKRK